MFYRILFLLGCLLSFVQTFADEPPSWEPFQVESLNKQFVAKVKIKKAGNEPWKSQWELSVYQGKKLLWQTPFQYSGYPEGMLTNDGAKFVVVDYWYKPKGAQVEIYDQKKKIKIQGQEFHIDPKKIIKTVSHEVWLHRDSEAQFINNEVLMLTVIDGRQIYINLNTGKFKD